MNRRLLSGLMAFCMLFTLFPVPTMGADTSGDADAWKAELSETIRDANREEFPEDTGEKFLAEPPEEPATETETPGEPSEPVTETEAPDEPSELPTEAETSGEPTEAVTQTETPDGLTGEPDAETEISEEPTLAAPPEEPVTETETPDEPSEPATEAETSGEPSEPATETEAPDEPSEPVTEAALMSSDESADETATLLDASGSCGGNLNWSYNSYSGALTFTGSGAMKDYTSGSAPWYSYYYNITSVSIPEGVTTIGKYAFYGLNSLSNVSLSNSLNTIGEGAFSYCSRLRSLTIPKSVTSFGKSVFSNCSNLTLTVEPGSPARTYAVENSLRHIVSDAPNTVLTAGGTCGDNLLWTLDSAGTLTIEGSGAMRNYTNGSAPWYSSYASQIKTVSVSEGVTSVGKYAFYYCSALTTVSLPENSTDEDAPPPFSSIGDYAFYNCSKLDTLSLPDGLTSIGYNAFYNCSALKSLSIPESVTSISSAFYGCSNLTLTVEPDSAARTFAVRNGIRHYVSDNPDKLISICGDCDEIGEGILWILDGDTLTIESPLSTSNRFMNGYSNSSGSYAPWYSYGSQIKTVEIQEGLDSIGAYAFYGLDFLNAVSLPKSLTHIGEGAFYNCSKLESLIIPKNASIGDSAFYGCDSKLTLTVEPDSAARTYAVRNGIKHIVSDNPDKVVSVSGSCGNNLMWTFDEDAAALTIEGAGKMNDFSSGYASWKAYAGKIETVTIADGVTSIGNYAFYDCSALRDINLPDSLESIGTGAFQNCAALESLFIPAGVTFVGGNAFSGCSHLTLTVEPDSAGRTYAVRHGVNHIVSDDPDKIVTQCGACGDNLMWTFDEESATLTIEGSGNMTHYSQQESGLSPWNAYADTMTTVVFSGDVASIGSCAFYKCSALANVTLPDSVTSIGDGAFGDCDALTTITLPDSVTSIGSSAFTNCDALTDVTLPKGLTAIGSYMFSNSDALTTITLPDSVTSVGWYAFHGCDALKNLTLPDGVTSIDSEAFSNCPALESLNIPENVASMGSRLFVDSPNLTVTVVRGSYGQGYVVRNNVRHVVAGEPGAVVTASGTFGDGFMWALDERTGTLMIDGSGPMKNFSISPYDANYAPWKVSHADKIKTLVVADGVTSIGNYAFSHCVSLTDVTLPEGLISIGDYAFHDCASLTEIVIPEGVTTIELGAFYECAALTSVTFPASLTLIDSHVFYNCVALEKIEFPDGLTTINNNAFQNCSSLTEVTIPDSVTLLQSAVFKDCASLRKVTLPQGLTTIYLEEFRNCSSLTDITIPDSVTDIEYGAFWSCAALESLTIPDSVASFSAEAFTNCSALTLTVSPDSEARTCAVRYHIRHVVSDDPDTVVTDCGTCGDNLLWTLVGATGTLTIEGSGDMKDYYNSFGNYAPWYSYHAGEIQTVVISDGVTNIGSYAFYECPALTNITIPDSVTSVRDCAFYNCDALTNVTLPESLTSVDSYAFYGCDALTNVTLPGKVTSVSAYAFYACAALTKAALPDGLTSIGSYAFYDCAALTNVTLPESLTSIDSGAFQNCAALESLSLPASVASFGSSVFDGCSALTLTVVRGSAGRTYAMSNRLKHVVADDSDKVVVVVASGTCGENGSNIFWTLDELTGTLTLEGSGNMSNYSSYSNAPWYSYKDQIRAVSVPEGVTNIGSYAFYGCSSMTSATIPESVASIGEGAFRDCAALTEITIPAAVTSINQHAFENCAALTKAVIPNGVTLFGYGAFSGCSALTDVAIPEGVTSIDSFAFSDCAALRNLTIPDSVTYIGNSAFSGCANLTLTVSRDMYGRTYVFDNGLQHVAADAPDKVVTNCGKCGESLLWLLYQNGELTFEGSGTMYDYYSDSAPWANYKSKITTVTVPDGVTKIGNNAFYGASALESVSIANSVTAIGQYAFYDCDALQSMEIPAAVTSIGSYAFSECDALTLSVTRGSYGRTYAIKNALKHVVSDDPDRLVTDCGTCGANGENVLWLFYEDGTLCFEGSGAMSDYSSDGLTNTAPWHSYFDRVSALDILDGVTRLGSYAFYGDSKYLNDYRFMSLETVTLPDSVISLGRYAFGNCAALTSVTLSNKLSSIEGYAFSGCAALTELTIPAATTSIGDNAFDACPNLTLAVYENSYAHEYVTEHDLRHTLSGAEDAPVVLHSGKCGDEMSWLLYSNGVLQFRGSGNMWDYGKQSDDAPRTTAPWHAYRDQITGVVIPEGVTKLGAYAFYGDTYYAADYRFNNLTSVSLPSSLLTLGAHAFHNCANLPGITLPEGLNEIGENAFSGCDAVNELTVPQSVETIRNNAFSDCANLTVKVYANSYAQTYVVEHGIRHIVDGSEEVIVASGTCGDNVNWLLYQNGTLKIDGSGAMWDYVRNGDIPRTTAPWYDYKDQIRNVTVSQGVTKIGAYAFYGGEYYTVNHRFANLERVTLSQSVETLSDYAFSGCVALKSVNLPETLQRIGRDAFSGCAALVALTLPQALSDIHQDAFSNCPNLTLEVYAGSASRLYVLRYNVKHTVVGRQDKVIASGVCGDNDSYGNPKLYWLVYEDGRLVFEGSGNMLDYSSENSHTTAPWHAYYDRVTSVTIPGGKDGVTKIGAYAFYGAKYYGQDYRFGKLAAVDIPESVTEIGAYAFKGCSALPSLTLRPSVDYIGEGAFADCYNLTLTVYPDTPGKTYALQNALKHVLYGSDRTVIASGECGASSWNPLYWLLYADGVLEFEGSGDMKGFPDNRNTAAKEGLWYRSEAPWYRYRDEIASVVIPEGVTRVGPHAFYGVTYYTADHRFSKLADVTLPDSLQSLGSYSFSGCASLTSLTLPENLSVIDSYAFANDTGLKTLVIPPNVAHIGENAFSGCRALTLKVYEDSVGLQYAQANHLRYQIGDGPVVPGADDGQPEPDPNPIPAPEHPFSVAQDAYSFVNEAKSFSYGDGVLTGDKYPISYAAFKLIFGDSVAGKSKYKQSKSGVWGGNCNGLAATAALFYAGITPLSGFNRQSVYALNIGDSDASMSVKTFVEAMQVAQYTDSFARDYQTNRRAQEQLASGKTLNDMLERVSADVAKGKCDIVAVGKNGVGAHAILAYNVEKVSDAEYRLYVYDCNFPGDTRYVTLTASGGDFTQWTYNMGASYGEWGSKDSKCFVSYIPFDTVRSIWDKRGDLYQTKEMLSVNVANLSIQDAEGNEVASLQDGQLVTDSPDIYEVPELSMHWSDTNSLYLPKDLYTIVNKDSKTLKASMTDLNLEAAVSTTSNNVTFAVDDASRENTVFIDGMTEADTYAVELSSSFADSQYKEFSIAGTGSVGMNGDTISVSGAKDALALSSNITYQTLSVNGLTQQKEDYYTIQASSGEGGAISPSGDVKVSANETQTFAFLPKPGYKLDRVEVNGTPVDLNGRSYYDLKADSDNGTTITAHFRKAYEIGSVTVDRAAKAAKAANLTNLTNSVLTGIVFDKDGKFVAYAAQALQAGATEGTVTFGATLPENCTVKLFLADENNKPLCAPVQ